MIARILGNYFIGRKLAVPIPESIVKWLMRLDFLFEKTVQTVNLLVLQVVSTHAYRKDIQAHMSRLYSQGKHNTLALFRA